MSDETGAHECIPIHVQDRTSCKRCGRILAGGVSGE